MAIKEDFYNEAIDILSLCRIGDKPMYMPPEAFFELQIIIMGGVEPRDIQAGVDFWVRANREMTSHWGYIRTVALAKAANRMMLQAEVN
jgi:hypothetical protein